MVQTGIRKSVVLVLTVLITLLAGGHVVFADEGGTKPLTPQPPATIQPLAVYSGYTYLLSSTIDIRNVTGSPGTLRIAVTTGAKSVVSVAGAIVQLQRYTGTAWTDVGSSTTLTANNSQDLSDYVEKAVTSGYYYRAKVTHYVTHGSVHESAVEYSASVLAS